ncbi:MAG: hypothetical protein ACR2JK_14715 [Geodermatophilaceae bacterium]
MALTPDDVPGMNWLFASSWGVGSMLTVAVSGESRLPADAVVGAASPVTSATPTAAANTALCRVSERRFMRYSSVQLVGLPLLRRFRS